MNAELLGQLQEISAASPAAFGLVILAGLIMGVAPSSVPLMSVVVGSVAGQSEGKPSTGAPRALLFSGGFVLGMATVDAAVGGLFGFAGYAVVEALAGYLSVTNLVIAALLAVMGLALLRIVRIPWPRVRVAPRPVGSFGAAYTLGIPFGLSTCPVCTPMVLPILGAAAATGEPWLGAALLFTFGVARGVPLLAAGTATGAAKHLRRLAPLVPKLERAGGVLLLLAAFYFVYQSAAYAGWVPPFQFLFEA